ncbi:MAG: DUF4397 domain-containing protein [Chitinophagales bacterium]
MKKQLMMMTAVGLLLATTACKKDDNTDNGTGGFTYVQYINASPAHQHSDFYLHGGGESYSLTDVYYLMGTSFGKYRTGSVTLTVEDSHGTLVNAAPLTGAKDKSYTFILFDSLPHVKYIVLNDTVPTSLPSGKGAIKFINVSPNAGNITYRLKGGATLATNLKYAGTNPTESYTSFIPVDAGWQDIQVLDANTLQVIDSLPLYTIKVDPGQSYTVWTGGYRGASVYPNQLKTFFTYDEIVP